jgi:hypothetical protein
LKTLRFLIPPDGGYRTFDALEAAAASFCRERPGLRIETAVVSEPALWGRFFRLLKNPGAEPCPDLAAFPSHWTSGLARLGLLKDLSCMDPPPGLGSFHEALSAHASGDKGEAFSLPWWMEACVLYRREGPLPPFSSMDDFLQACSDLGPASIAGSDGTVRWRDVAPFVWARGGDFLAEGGARCLFCENEAVRGAEDFFGLLAGGRLVLWGEEGLPAGFGDCPLTIGSRFRSWHLSERSRRQSRPGPHARGLARALPKGSVPFPPWPEGRGVLTGRSLGVLRDGDNPAQAWALARHLAGAAAPAFAEAIGALPAAACFQDEALTRAGECGPAFRDSLASARALPGGPASGTLERVLEKAFDRLAGMAAEGALGPGCVRGELSVAAREMESVLEIHG